MKKHIVAVFVLGVIGLISFCAFKAHQDLEREKAETRKFAQSPEVKQMAQVILGIAKEKSGKTRSFVVGDGKVTETTETLPTLEQSVDRKLKYPNMIEKPVDELIPNGFYSVSKLRLTRNIAYIKMQCFFGDVEFEEYKWFKIPVKNLKIEPVKVWCNQTCQITAQTVKNGKQELVLDISDQNGEFDPKDPVASAWRINPSGCYDL